MNNGNRKTILVGRMKEECMMMGNDTGMQADGMKPDGSGTGLGLYGDQSDRPAHGDGSVVPSGLAFTRVAKTYGWWLLVVMLLVGGLAGSIVGWLLYTMATGDLGVAMVQGDDGMVSMAMNSGMLATVTVASMLATGVSSVVFFYWKWRKRAPEDVGCLSTRDSGKTNIGWMVLIGFLIGGLFYAAYLGISWLFMRAGVNVSSSDTGQMVSDMIRDMLHSGSWVSMVGLVLMVFCVSILSPFGEELVFRGMIGRVLVDSPMLRAGSGARSWWQSLLVCLLSGAFFGVVHFTGFGWAGISPVVMTTLFGALLTWVSSMRTRSLWLAASAHVAFNGLQMVLLLVSLMV